MFLKYVGLLMLLMLLPLPSLLLLPGTEGSELPEGIVA